MLMISLLLYKSILLDHSDCYIGCKKGMWAKDEHGMEENLTIGLLKGQWASQYLAVSFLLQFDKELIWAAVMTAYISFEGES